MHVDGGMNSHTGLHAWGRVVDATTDQDLLLRVTTQSMLLSGLETKQVVLPQNTPSNVILAKFNDVTTQQNNGAELLALVAGLRIALADPDQRYHTIGCDSMTVLAWSKGSASIGLGITF